MRYFVSKTEMHLKTNVILCTYELYVIQIHGRLKMSKQLQQENVEKIGKYVFSLRAINDEIYCCTHNSIEVYSKDLQLRRSITSSSFRGFNDVTERDEDHVFVARFDGLFVFTKSGKNITLFTSY